MLPRHPVRFLPSTRDGHRPSLLALSIIGIPDRARGNGRVEARPLVSSDALDKLVGAIVFVVGVFEGRVFAATAVGIVAKGFHEGEGLVDRLGHGDEGSTSSSGRRSSRVEALLALGFATESFLKITGEVALTQLEADKHEQQQGLHHSRTAEKA
jgi:hypothetical protein